ncbi:MAG: adenylate/guanylate cyclase domain-containing protein, partial [Bdellovibrionales bacterium]|nr:adenylate/guanylate cyclase domain-containing protein [Bdellovibrionales bacterium]
LPGERDMIKYYGGAATIQTYSYYQVVDPEKPLPAELLKDRIVFVGLVLLTDLGPAQKDIFMTPFGRVFGTEIHATATLNLLHQDWIRRASQSKETIGLALACLVLTILLFALRPLTGMIVLVSSIILWMISAYFSYTSNFFLPGTLLVGAFLPLAFLSTTLYYYFVTRRAQLKMEGAFQLYVSPDMVKQISKDEKGIGLGGEKVWATALFTDIADFTSITESMPAERVAAMLNAYFTEVMDEVFKNNGTLVKFIGDAVFVLWGAPIKINDHALKACQTALAIHEAVKRFNASERFPALHTRIGLNTGPMVVGNLGSAKRFDYTAIGDSVNLASRVEGINKYFGTSILITESVRKEIGDALPTLLAASLKVKGKSEVVKLYMLFDNFPMKDVCELWNDALEQFRSAEWDKAIELFEKSAAKEERLSKAKDLYLEEISLLRAEPPKRDWQGEIAFDSK